MGYIKKKTETKESFKVGKNVITLREFSDDEGILEKGTRVRITSVNAYTCEVKERKSKRKFVLPQRALYYPRWEKGSIFSILLIFFTLIIFFCISIKFNPHFSFFLSVIYLLIFTVEVIFLFSVCANDIEEKYKKMHIWKC